MTLKKLSDADVESLIDHGKN